MTRALLERLPAVGRQVRGAPQRWHGRARRRRPRALPVPGRLHDRHSQHLPAPRPPAPPSARAVQRLGARAAGEDLPDPLRQGRAGRGDDLLGARRTSSSSTDCPRRRSPSCPGGSVLSEYPAPTPDDLDRLRARLSLPESFLLYPAQTWPHKNHERLLEALARVRDESGVTIPLVCPGQADAPLPPHPRARGSSSAWRRRRPSRASSARAISVASTSSGRGWSSRAGSRAGGCRSARRSTPVCPSPHPPRPGSPKSSATRDCCSTRTTSPRWHASCIGSGPTRGSGRTSVSGAGERAAEFSFDHTARLFRAHYRQVAHRSLTEEDRILLASPPPA